VQAIANQTMRPGVSLEEARAAFSSRLGALAREQDILTQTSSLQADIHEVIGGALEPHGGLSRRLRCEGPALRLSSKCALAMSLAIHELATNASKYGALSNDAGRVEVSCAAAGDTPSPRFRFQWRELGGPSVAQPERVGFGSRMLERALAGYFNGTAKMAYEPDGLVYTLESPLGQLVAE